MRNPLTVIFSMFGRGEEGEWKEFFVPEMKLLLPIYAQTFADNDKALVDALVSYAREEGAAGMIGNHYLKDIAAQAVMNLGKYSIPQEHISFLETACTRAIDAVYPVSAEPKFGNE